VGGITNGANILGERGCLGDDEPVCRGVFCPSSPGVSNMVISALSSSAGPDIKDIRLSPNMCCLQLFPGALIERSCRGGRPGIVAVIISLIYVNERLEYAYVNP